MTLLRKTLNSHIAPCYFFILIATQINICFLFTSQHSNLQRNHHASPHSSHNSFAEAVQTLQPSSVSLRRTSIHVSVHRCIGLRPCCSVSNPLAVDVYDFFELAIAFPLKVCLAYPFALLALFLVLPLRRQRQARRTKQQAVGHQIS